jgi:uncharacterized protein YraI
VKYPVVSGAATNSQFTINYSGGSSTQTVDQSQNNGNGWVAIGKYALTQSGSGQQVSSGRGRRAFLGCRCHSARRAPVDAVRPVPDVDRR